MPSGGFVMGSDPRKDKLAQPNEQPQHQVSLREFLIGKYPVTNRQYQSFVKSTGHRPPRNWKNGQIPAGKEAHPVVRVNWQDASAFCEWAGEVSGYTLQLPSEAEWEKAARGTDGRIYPWGNQAPDARLCNFDKNVNDTTPVGSYSPQGDSPYGASDMAGNVWEWVADWYGETYYKNSPANNPGGPPIGNFRVLRGGSWTNSDFHLRTSNRDNYDPTSSGNVDGFRCVCEVSPPGNS